MKFPKPIPRKQFLAARRSRLARDTADLRELVAARSGGYCEHCGKRRAYLQMDHWLSGNGRRRTQQGVDTCWLLCHACHYSRTRNNPSAAAWNQRFAAHCRKYGYAVVGHIEHMEVLRGRDAP